jgi:parallel beta helix pectate lyase-like protein
VERYRRRVHWWPVFALAAVTMMLSSTWVADTAVTRSGLGADLLRPAEPPPVMGCSVSNVVCLTGDSTSRIEVTTSNVIYDGRGFSSVGITVNASNVVIQNFNFTNCAGNCIWMKGDGNIVLDNKISQVYYAGDDIDGLRFFGNDTKILRNQFFDILKGPKHDSHLDCMQTWADTTTGGGSSRALIQGNDCRDADFRQCVMVEGPRSTDGGGGGPGVTRGWVIDSNHFQCYANQTVALRDVHNFVIRNNNFAGAGRKAIQQADGTSGIALQNNVLGPGYNKLTGD